MEFYLIFMLFLLLFRRCQTSREGNLDSADMESNSSKNSHGRDYWGNQQVRTEQSESKVCWTLSTYNLSCFRRRARHRVARIKLHRRATRDEARRLLKARVARREFRRTSDTSSAMEVHRQRKCRRLQCSWAVGRRTSQRSRALANWRSQAERKRPPPTSSRVNYFNLSLDSWLTTKLHLFRNPTERSVSELFADGTRRGSAEPVGEGTLRVGDSQPSEGRTRHARLPA